MTLDEIQKMPGRDVDAAIAEQVMGTPVQWVGGNPVIGRGARGEQITPLYYHKRLDDCHDAEERLKEMGLRKQWIAAFDALIPAPSKDGREEWVDGILRSMWEKRHATARQRAEAILLAVQEDNP